MSTDQAATFLTNALKGCKGAAVFLREQEGRLSQRQAKEIAQAFGELASEIDALLGGTGISPS